MRSIHLTHNDYTVGTWSGGETTQIYIYPDGADYSKRCFEVRISSARVDLEESDFTPLEGVTRFITPLTGGFTLMHPEHEPVVMKPLDAPYHFSGGIATHCIGKATDFNLMLKGVDGSMQIAEGSAAIRSGLNAFYPIKDCVMSIAGVNYCVKAGELLIIFDDKEYMLGITSGQVICCYADIGIGE